MGTLQNASNANLSNFDVGVSTQTGEYWVPEIFSKKIQNFFRKSSVIEAITNTDYAGEISGFGDTVKIIKEPTVTVAAYTRAAATTKQYLTDAEATLVIDKANSFKFIIDDIEERMSHVNWASVGASSAAYKLKDTMDAEVIAAIIILTREILISGLREFLAKGQIKLPVSNLAKLKTFLQMFSIAILLTGETGKKLINFQDYDAQTIGIIFLWFSAFLTLYTGYEYLRKGIDHAISQDNKN